MKAGDVVHMKSFTHSEPGMSVGYKANSDKVAVFLLLGHAPRKTPGEFDPTDALKRLGWQLNAPAHPADELGKVWDVLHDAGINSGGELSASEGVKLLAGRFTGELMDAYQALQEDFAKLKAREDAARMLLHDASVSLYAKGMSKYEQPRVAMIAWLEE